MALTLFSCRYILSYLGFFCTMVVYFCRINLSIAIVKIVEEQSRKDKWTQAQRGDLLGCYYYGYVCTQIIGAWMSSKFGFKWLLFAATLISSILTIFTPLMVDFGGYGWIFAARIIIGFFHGVTFPLLTGCWGIWGPPLERSNLIAIYVAGNSVGTCLIFPLGGLLAGSTWGWRSIFYTTGISGILWCLAWMFLAYDSPARHPRISDQEKEYIETSIAEYQKTNVPPTSTPWKDILKSPVVWSVAVAHLASNWSVYQMNSLLPTYLNDVLHFDIESNGLISAAPFICQTVLTFFSGWFSDFIRSKGWMRTITVRKLNNLLGLLIPGITLVLAGYAGTDANLAVFLFTVSVGFTAFTVPGPKSSMMEFAPQYGGIIFAISNTVSNLSGFLAPITTGRLINEESTIERWQLAFWISGLINLPGLIAFTIFGTDQIQTWAQQ